MIRSMIRSRIRSIIRSIIGSIIGRVAPGARGAMVALAAAALLAELVVLPPMAQAAPPTVILLQPASASASARRCLTRIGSELVAGGFEVDVADHGAAEDPVSAAQAINRERGAIATMTLLGDPEAGPVELWIIDRLIGPGAVRRIVVPTDNPARVPEILAVRALEALRASAFELGVQSDRAQTPMPITKVAAADIPGTSAPPPPVQRPSHIGLEMGMSALESLGGPGVALIPMVRLRLRSSGLPFLRVGLAGLGRQPRIDAVQGSARVEHDLALVDGGLSFRAGRHFRPAVTLGAGALRVSVDGDGRWPYEGTGGERWTALFDVGAGFTAAVVENVSLSLELHGVWAAPHPVVRFAGVDVATVARPGFIVALTVVAWL